MLPHIFSRSLLEKLPAAPRDAWLHLFRVIVSKMKKGYRVKKQKQQERLQQEERTSGKGAIVEFHFWKEDIQFFNAF